MYTEGAVAVISDLFNVKYGAFRSDVVEVFDGCIDICFIREINFVHFVQSSNVDKIGSNEGIFD